MKKASLKGLMGCGSVIGGGCAIGVPVALNSQQDVTIMKMQENSGGAL